MLPPMPCIMFCYGKLPLRNNIAEIYISFIRHKDRKQICKGTQNCKATKNTQNKQKTTQNK